MTNTTTFREKNPIDLTALAYVFVIFAVYEFLAFGWAIGHNWTPGTSACDDASAWIMEPISVRVFAVVSAISLLVSLGLQACFKDAVARREMWCAGFFEALTNTGLAAGSILAGSTTGAAIILAFFSRPGFRQASLDAAFVATLAFILTFFLSLIAFEMLELDRRNRDRAAGALAVGVLILVGGIYLYVSHVQLYLLVGLIAFLVILVFGWSEFRHRISISFSHGRIHLASKTVNLQVPQPDVIQSATKQRD